MGLSQGQRYRDCGPRSIPVPRPRVAGVPDVTIRDRQHRFEASIPGRMTFMADWGDKGVHVMQAGTNVIKV